VKSAKIAGITLGLFLATLVIPSAFALQINVTTDKKVVFPGDNVTITASVKTDNGTAQVFDVRVAAVAPPKVLVCDTNRTKTDANGTITFVCNIPTLQQLNASGVPAALTRAAIPIRGGIAVLDNATNQTIKKHTDRALILLNRDKWNAKANEIIARLNEVVNRSSDLAARCEEAVSKAATRNLTLPGVNCASISAVGANAAAMIANLTATRDNPAAADFESFRTQMASVRDAIKALREQAASVRESIRSALEQARETIRETARQTREAARNATNRTTR